MDKILITGMAGFIGSHLAARCVKAGFQVVGLDNLNDYYDVNLKLDRLKFLGFSSLGDADIVENRSLGASENLAFIKTDLTSRETTADIFHREKPEVVIHMAAQAGVRHSIEHPHAYIRSNIEGFLNVLEGCRHHRVKHLLFASSSSVYGLNRKMPYSEHDHTDHPVSLYGATKKGGEMMAHAYSRLYGIPCTGLRLFTVYGPYGRPDMSPMIFSRRIVSGQFLEVFNYGRMERDFTYIDDVTEAICRLIPIPPAENPEWNGQAPDPQESAAPYRIINVGGGRPQKLEDFIQVLARFLGKKARKRGLPMQKGDVLKTYSDTSELYALTGFTPVVDLEEGIRRFVRWYKDYHGIRP